MPFSRTTVLEACQSLQYQNHTGIDTFMLRLQLDQFAQSYGANKESRCNQLFRYLQENPGAELDGRPLVQVVVEQAVRLALSNDYLWRNGTFDPLIHSLERDGFVIEDGRLRAAMPGDLDLPAADDEVHLLLNRYNLATPLGHLNQAITAHGRGDWAAANSQIRSAFESLLDEIAYLLVPNAPRGRNQGEARREALANLQRPFLSLDLNEWGNQGKNLVNGVFKRLHPQGAHPGLSDEEDSTFRLHLVLLAARLFLRRLDALLRGQP